MPANKHHKKILKILEGMYPDARTELQFKNEYELIVAVILSAQCTDKKVNEITPELFKQYPDFASLASADIDSVSTLIRQVNYYVSKSKHIVAMAKIVSEEYEGKLSLVFEHLTLLPGVGRKTANVLLGEIGATPAIAVDTHVFRVAKRLGLSEGSKPIHVETDLMELYPAVKWKQVHHSLVLHGRRICKAQRPLCEMCILLKYCPTGQSREDGKKTSMKAA